MGAHRFYLQMRVSGFGMLCLACVAGVTFFFRTCWALRIRC